METEQLLERLVADALTSIDPEAAFDRAARRRDLTDELRDALRRASRPGILMSALLVARLRFDRLMLASEEAVAWNARDSDGFARAFLAYHHTVSLSAITPEEEAALFAKWRRGRR